MTTKAVMVKALDTLMSEEEEEEISQVFALMYELKKKCEDFSGELDEILSREMEDEVL